MKHILIFALLLLFVGCEDDPLSPTSFSWAEGEWVGHMYADSTTTPADIHALSLNVSLADANMIVPALSCSGPLYAFSEANGYGTVSVNSLSLTCSFPDGTMAGTLAYQPAGDIDGNNVLAGYLHHGPREFVVRLTKQSN